MGGGFVALQKRCGRVGVLGIHPRFDGLEYQRLLGGRQRGVSNAPTRGASRIHLREVGVPSVVAVRAVNHVGKGAGQFGGGSGRMVRLDGLRQGGHGGTLSF